MGPLAAQLSAEDYNTLINRHGGVEKLSQVSDKIANELDAELAQRNLEAEPITEPEVFIPQPISYRANASVILESSQPSLDIYA
jgi:hypothetical protein